MYSALTGRYGLTSEREACIFRHSTNRDVRYAERELHFVIPFTLQGIIYLAIFFSSSMEKGPHRPLIPLLKYWCSVLICYLKSATRNYPTIVFLALKKWCWSCLNKIE
ncbi:hypothetical protein FPI77_11575 [Klebsiella quasivariicola]|nr:hypothetical protein [Klebsiella quasivariicola]QBL49592.1 hypothetical protein BMD99_014210 [Klebsiella sp. PO552]TTN50002.1 hypothetical protein FPI77_11575 [Klebsiella quasivariicola]